MLESDTDLAEAISAFIEPHFTATISHDLADGELLFRDDRYAGMLLNTAVAPKLDSVLALITRLRNEGDRREAAAAGQFTELVALADHRLCVSANICVGRGKTRLNQIRQCCFHAPPATMGIVL